MSDKTEFNYTSEDVVPRHPDRFRRRGSVARRQIQWRPVLLIVVGFSVVQVLWLVALGVGR